MRRGANRRLALGLVAAIAGTFTWVAAAEANYPYLRCTQKVKHGKAHKRGLEAKLEACTAELEACEAGGGDGAGGVLRTGQTECWDAAGVSTDCTGTGQDGDIQAGAEWPTPRFTRNGDGTVADNLTGLTWLADASCLGAVDYGSALTAANTLAGGACGLSDGSVAGEWRLPNINELQSVLDRQFVFPSLSNAAGTGQWTPGDPFDNLVSAAYWSSTTIAWSPTDAWGVNLDFATVNFLAKGSNFEVLPVRDGP